jgi:uncharacterized surface protein with fasciclin (FAS1) repeats
MVSGENSRTLCDAEGNFFQKGTANPRDDMVSKSKGENACTFTNNTLVILILIPIFLQPQIMTADIEACNGIIHIIDKVSQALIYLWT